MTRIAIDPILIRERAHARWLARGCPQGAGDQDWLEAERELQREAAVSAQQSEALSRSAGGESAAVSPRPQLQPPRPRLRRSPTARTAHLHNEIWLQAEVRPRGDTPLPPGEVAPKPLPQTLVQQALAAARAVVKQAG